MDEEFINIYIEKLNQRVSDLIKNETIMIAHLESANKKLQILDEQNVRLSSEIEVISVLNQQIEEFKSKEGELELTLKQTKIAVGELENQLNNEIHNTQREKNINNDRLIEIVNLKQEIGVLNQEIVLLNEQIRKNNSRVKTPKK
jgi:hypothetical protein